MSDDARDGVRRALLALDGIEAAMGLGVKWDEATEIRETVIEALREDAAVLIADAPLDPPPAPKQARLGYATTGELLAEITARIRVDESSGGGGLDYRTVGS